MSSGHTHHVGRGDARYLTAALGLILAYMVVEVVIGLMASSLALVTDAAHMLTDAAALGLALFAARLAARPARGNLTYGLRRVEILSAQANGLTLWLLAVWFVYQAITRFLEPPSVNGVYVLVTALVGVLVNLLATWLTSRANRTSLNVEGAFQHILNDLFAFIATAIAGLVVMVADWHRADAVAALVVAALMVKGGWGLIRDSWRVFLEAAPPGVNVASIDADLHGFDGVVEIHDLHVWEVTSGFPALSAHVLVGPDWDCHERREAMAALLADQYEIEHTTIQVEHPATQRIISPDEVVHPDTPPGSRTDH